MIFCLLCKKNLKNKNAWIAHENTDKHKENFSSSDLKTIFRINFISLIYKYNEFKDIVSIYKEFLQKYNLSYKMAGYKNLEEINLAENVAIRREGGIVYVKGFGNYFDEKREFKIEIKWNNLI
jgi:hypothetical protein